MPPTEPRLYIVSFLGFLADCVDGVILRVFGCELGALAGTVEDELMRAVRQTIQGAIAEDRVVPEIEPFVDGAVGGHDEARPTVAFDDEFVEIAGLLSGETMEAEVIDDEQVGSEVGAEGLGERMVGAGLTEIA